MAICDECNNFQYDDEDECYYCVADMDEDDVYRLTQRQYKSCPFFSSNNEYEVVKKQI